MRYLSQELGNYVHRILSWVQKADVKNLDDLVNEYGQKSFVAYWHLGSYSQVVLSVACHVVQCELEQVKDCRQQSCCLNQQTCKLAISFECFKDEFDD